VLAVLECLNRALDRKSKKPNQNVYVTPKTDFTNGNN
jgi:hypothetical protein